MFPHNLPQKSEKLNSTKIFFCNQLGIWKVIWWSLNEICRTNKSFHFSFVRIFFDFCVTFYCDDIALRRGSLVISASFERSWQGTTLLMWVRILSFVGENADMSARIVEHTDAIAYWISIFFPWSQSCQSKPHFKQECINKAWYWSCGSSLLAISRAPLWFK